MRQINNSQYFPSFFALGGIPNTFDAIYSENLHRRCHAAEDASFPLWEIREMCSDSF